MSSAIDKYPGWDMYKIMTDNLLKLDERIRSIESTIKDNYLRKPKIVHKRFVFDPEPLISKIINKSKIPVDIFLKTDRSYFQMMNNLDLNFNVRKVIQDLPFFVDQKICFYEYDREDEKCSGKYVIVIIRNVIDLNFILDNYYSNSDLTDSYRVFNFEVLHSGCIER